MNYNFPHLLRDNKRSKYPQKFIFFDTETKQVKLSDKETEHKLRLGVAVYIEYSYKKGILSEQWFNFKTKKEFWDFVKEKSYKKSRLVLIAHNIQFDFKVMSGFDELVKRGYELGKFILSNNANIWKFKTENHSILVLDNLNYFRNPLKVLGRTVGLEKIAMPDDKEIDEIWFNYCKRDVEILKVSWIKWINFVKKNDLGCFGLTLASQSFNAYRHRFKDYPIYIHKNRTITELERESYHGGRTECFYIGNFRGQTFYSLDFNSMYPYVMREFEYPTKLTFSYESCSRSELSSALKKFAVIARVKLDVKENVFPYRQDNRLIFPTGIFETVLTTEELKLALKMNAVKEVKETAVYQKALIFRSFVDYFYSLRKEYKKKGNYLYNYLSKIIMNSLYGKFGQRIDVFEQIAFRPDLPNSIEYIWDWEEQRKIIRRIIMGKVEVSKEKIEGFNAFAAIPSEVSANARLHLYNAIKRAGKENVFYCDTDSLFVNEKGFKNLRTLISSSKLGYLKIEESDTELEIRGLKDYTFKGRTKIKGIKRDALKISENVFTQVQFEKVKSSLYKGRLNKQVMFKITKRLKRNYKKGEVLPSGKIIPFNLTEICVKTLF